MKIFKRNIDIKQILMVLVVIVAFTSIQLYILTMYRKHGDADFNDVGDLITTYVFAFVAIGFTLGFYKIFSKYKLPALQKVLLTFFVSFLGFNMLIVILDFIFFNQDFPYVFWDRVLNAFSIAVLWHIQISLITLGYLNLTESRKAKSDLQIAQKEKENLQLRVLRKNLEPHFLFNNLNVLSGLSKKNPEKIDDFIDDFSEVYRYYLKNDKQDVVPLSEEITFLKQYMNLIQNRFRNAYQLQLNIKNDVGFIVPCAIQLCVENAIKHNKGSEGNPLQIHVFEENNHILIANNLNKVDFTVGTKTGNVYLKDQYRILFDKEVVVKESNEEFIVKIPIIN